jgi:hypothetical protein
MLILLKQASCCLLYNFPHSIVRDFVISSIAKWLPQYASWSIFISYSRPFLCVLYIVIILFFDYWLIDVKQASFYEIW